MILKRQKLGAFQLTKEIGADGLEVDMGSLGDRETFESQLGKPELRQQFLDKAAELSDNSPNLEYNLGLGYFDLRSYDKSLLHAKRAYDGGFPLPGLREKLRQVGQWKE